MERTMQAGEFRSVSYVYGLFALMLLGAFLCFSSPAHLGSAIQSPADLLLVGQGILLLLIAVGIRRHNLFFGYFLGLGVAAAYIGLAIYNLALGEDPIGPVLLAIFWIAAGSNLYRSYALLRRAQNVKLPIE
ncbi:MAG: hypothetical protein U0136_16505 [Bdellovibrionota bacterium]